MTFGSSFDGSGFMACGANIKLLSCNITGQFFAQIPTTMWLFLPPTKTTARRQYHINGSLKTHYHCWEFNQSRCLLDFCSNQIMGDHCHLDAPYHHLWAFHLNMLQLEGSF